MITDITVSKKHLWRGQPLEDPPPPARLSRKRHGYCDLDALRTQSSIDPFLSYRTDSNFSTDSRTI